MINTEHLNKIKQHTADNVSSLLVYFNKDLICLYANKAYADWFGIDPEKLKNNMPLREMLTATQYNTILPYYNQALLGNKQVFEQSLTSFQGEKRHVMVSVTPDISADQIIGFYCQVSDITLLKKIEEARKENQKSKRIYAFISSINDLVLHAKNEAEIFSRICSIAVNEGDFLFSWIGKPDTDSNQIRPVNWAGFDHGFMEFIQNTSVTNITDASDPASIAYREASYYCSNDFENDPAFSNLKTEALKRGYHSVIALPVIVTDKVIAIFNIYADKPEFFTADEIKLLIRVSDNISFALSKIYIDKKYKETETQLLKVTQAVEQSSSSIVITNILGDIEYINPAFTALTGYTFDEAKGQNPHLLKTGYTTDAEYGRIWKKLFNKETWIGEFYNKKKNGDTYWEQVNISPVLNDEGFITNFIAVKENITERKKLEEEQYRLLSIIENSSAFIAISDLNNKFIYGNKAIKDILEISDETITDYFVNDFSTESCEIIKADVKKSLRETGKWIGESIYRSKSGKQIPVLQVFILHMNEKGENTHISGTAIDLSLVKEAENEQRRLNKELRSFSWHLQNMSEIEKNKLAQEMHDELGQGLISLKLEAFAIKMNMHDDKKVIEKKIDGLLNSINEQVQAFKRIYNSVNPTLLNDIGLFNSIENLVITFKRSYAINTRFESNMNNDRIDHDISLSLFRITQECFSNIRLYSFAKNCSIKLLKQDNTLLLEIEDDGCGFETSEVDYKLHHGILDMRERTYAINGSFTINSVPGKGTNVKVEVPLIEKN